MLKGATETTNASGDDATEYPDTRRLAAYGRTKDQFGEQLFDIRTLDER